MHDKRNSDYYLERYVLNELPGDEFQVMKNLEARDASVKAAIEEIRRSNADILALYPPDAVVEALQKNTQKTNIRHEKRAKRFVPSAFRLLLIYGTGLAALVLALLFVLPGFKKDQSLPFPLEQKDVTLIKGVPRIDLTKTQLLIFRKSEDRIDLVDSGEKAEAGDLLQLGYVAVDHPFGIIFSIDGRGGVSLHFPAERDGSTRLDLNKQALLSHAIELDDAPGFERFFFLTSRDKIDADQWLRRAEFFAEDRERALKENMALEEGLHQYSVLIRKGEDR